MSGPDLVVVGKSPWPSPIASSGSFAYAAAIAEGLGAKYHVIVPRASTQQPRHEQAGRLTVHRVGTPRFLPFLLGSTRTARRLVRGRGGDVLLVSSDAPGGLVCEFARAGTKIAHVFSVQGEVVQPGVAYGSTARRAVLAAVVRLGLRRATAVRVVNESLAHQVRRITTHPVHVVGARVDTLQFRPTSDPASAAGAVVVASLIPLKNIELVLRAWAVLPRDLQRQGLNIVGDGPAAKPLEQLAARLGIGGNVTFAGRLPHAEVAEMMRRSRVLVLPSFSEGHPRAVLEALACGVPVILSDIDSHQELLTTAAGAATLVRSEDIAMCASALGRLLGAPPVQWLAISRLAREAAVTHYDFDANVGAFVSMIRAVSESTSP